MQPACARRRRVPAIRAACRPAVGMFARNRAAAAAAAPPKAGIPLERRAAVAAKRLQESKQTIPHFYLQTSVNAAAMIARRKAAEPVKLAWDAFFVLAVAKAIARFDRFRCRLDGERLMPVESDAIGVAVDTGNELYVIPIASPAAKTVEQISDEIRQSVERLRGGDPEVAADPSGAADGDQSRRLQRRGLHPDHQSARSGRPGRRQGRARPPCAQDDGQIGVEHALHAHVERGSPHRQREVRGRIPRRRLSRNWSRCNGREPDAKT